MSVMFHCVFFMKFIGFFWPCLRIKSWIRYFRSGSPSHTQGVLHLPDASVPAKLAINFSADDYPYWVLKTDYVSFAVIFDCSESEEERWVIIYFYAFPFINQIWWLSSINYSYFAYFSSPDYNYGRSILQLTVFFSVQMTWILTREQNLTAAVITEVDAVLAKNKILQTSYKQLNPLCKWNLKNSLFIITIYIFNWHFL